MDISEKPNNINNLKIHESFNKNIFYFKLSYYFHHVVNFDGKDAFQYTYLHCE